MHKKTLEKFESVRLAVLSRRLILKSRRKIQNAQSRARAKSIRDGTYVQKNILFPADERRQLLAMAKRAGTS